MSPRPFYPKKSNAILILVLGIMSFTYFGPLTGIPVWIMGRTELENIKMGITDPSDKTIVQTGIVLGIVGSIFTVVWVAIEIYDAFVQ